jgi:hypothetical protein
MLLVSIEIVLKLKGCKMYVCDRVRLIFGFCSPEQPVQDSKVTTDSIDYNTVSVLLSASFTLKLTDPQSSLSMWFM